MYVDSTGNETVAERTMCQTYNRGLTKTDKAAVDDSDAHTLQENLGLDKRSHVYRVDHETK